MPFPHRAPCLMWKLRYVLLSGVYLPVSPWAPVSGLVCSLVFEMPTTTLAATFSFFGLFFFFSCGAFVSQWMMMIVHVTIADRQPGRGTTALPCLQKKKLGKTSCRKHTIKGAES